MDMKTYTITGETRVSDAVRANPALSATFEGLGIDYCCGGGIPLSQACQQKGLDPATVVAMLNLRPVESGGSDLRVDEYSTQDLIRHIVDVHHGYLRKEVPRLQELASRVAQAHGEDDPRLVQAEEVFDELIRELMPHQDHEEKTVFPEILEADGGRYSGPDIDELVSEHEAVGTLLKRLSELTNGYQPPAKACPKTLALFHGLKDLESDLHRHIYKENFVLFPRITSSTPGQ